VETLKNCRQNRFIRHLLLISHTLKRATRAVTESMVQASTTVAAVCQLLLLQ